MSKPGKKMSFEQARQKEAVERIQAAALEAKQHAQDLEKILERLCDDLLQAGNTPEALREYWSDYLSPEEREDG